MSQVAGVDGPGAVQERLLGAVRAAGAGSSRLIVLLGQPPRTARASRWARDRAPGPWQEWTPAGPVPLVEGLRRLRRRPAVPWTLLWLDDLGRFLPAGDPALAAAAAAELRAALADEGMSPLLVLASLRPDPETWHRLTRPPASGGTTPDRAQAQALLRGALVLAVPDAPVAAAPTAEVSASGLTPSPSPIPIPIPIPVAVGAESRDLRDPVPAAEPVAEPEPVVEPEPEPVVEPEPEPVVEPEPVAGPAPARPQGGIPRWTPSAVTEPADPPDDARSRAVRREEAGNMTGAARLYEQAAMAGDLEALARLGRLREAPGAEGTGARLDAYVDQAVAEGNTAVLFTLAASGHPRALAELARLRTAPPDAGCPPESDAGRAR